MASRTGGAIALWRVNADGSGLRRLSHGTDAFGVSGDSPTWSPDGRSIAYVNDKGNGLWAMDADGSRVRPLQGVPADFNPDHPAWSPDGVHIVFDYVPNGLWILDLRAHRIRQISTASDDRPSWSPDGKQIAFSHDATGNGDDSIWVMDADGSHRRQVTHPPPEHDGDHRSAWSPDGKSIAFERFDDTWVVNLATGKEHLVAKFANNPTWSPSGRVLLVSAVQLEKARADPQNALSHSCLCWVSPEGGKLHPVVEGEYWLLSYSAWQPAKRQR